MYNDPAFQSACIGVAVSATAGLGGLYLWRHSRERYALLWSIAWILVGARWAMHYAADGRAWLQVIETGLLAAGSALVLLGVYESLPRRRYPTGRVGLLLAGIALPTLALSLVGGAPAAIKALYALSILHAAGAGGVLWHGWRSTRQAGFLVLVITGAAWVALNIAGLLALGDAWRNSVLYPLIALPMVIGFLMVAFERAHQRMVDAERKLDRIFDTAPVPLIVARWPRGEAEQFNRATLELTGLTADELLGHTGAEYSERTNQEQVREVLSEVRAGRPVTGRELVYDFPHGRRILAINANSVELEDGPRYIFALHDLTRVRELEAQARASLEKFTALFNMNPVGIVVVDVQADRIIEINDAALAIGGFSREKAFATPTGQMLDWLDQPARQWREATLRGGGKLHDVPGSFRRPDTTAGGNPGGTIVHVLISGLPLMWDGRPHLILTYRDVSLQRHAEAAVMDLNNELEVRVARRTAELETANRDLEGFSYTVAHDLRAPLRAITGFASVLQEDWGDKLPEGGADSLARISAAALRMSGLLDGLLEFARTGRAQIEVREVDMGLLVREVLAENPDVALGRVRVHVGELPAARGDALLLMQVWRNLIENACKFSRDGEKPEIHIGAAVVERLTPEAAGDSTAGNVRALMRRGVREADEAAQAAVSGKTGAAGKAGGTSAAAGASSMSESDPVAATVGTSSAGEGAQDTRAAANTFIEYHVRDNGVGFDMRHASKLFGVFNRLQNDARFEGTGVGLAIVQRIVTRHGGQVRAEARLGDGAAFYFHLGT